MFFERVQKMIIKRRIPQLKTKNQKLNAFVPIGVHSWFQKQFFLAFQVRPKRKIKKMKSKANFKKTWFCTDFAFFCYYLATSAAGTQKTLILRYDTIISYNARRQ